MVFPVQTPHKTRVFILAFAVVLLLGGTAWAAFTVSGSGFAAGEVTEVEDLVVSEGKVAKKDAVFPGGTGDVVVNVQNKNIFGVTIESFVQSGPITTNKAACDPALFTFTPPTGTRFVDAKTTRVFNLHDALALDASADNDCAKAKISIPLMVTGVQFMPDPPPITTTLPATTTTVVAGSVGDLVITEVMKDPSGSDTAGEWFEIRNISGSPISLDGWTISDDGSDSHVIAGSVVVPAGGFVVLGNNANAATNGGAPVDYSYGGSFVLGNGADEIILTDPTAVVFDRIAYASGWPDNIGAAMNLDPSSTDIAANDDSANWCDAGAPFGAGDLGTPGAPNTLCP